MRKLFFTAAAALMLASCGGSAEPEAAEPIVPTHLNGSWTASSLVMGGNAFPPEMTKGINLKINSYVYETKAMGQSETGKLVYHDDHTPKRLEIVPENGPMSGTTMYAIYKLEGNQMTVAYSPADYPSGFASTAANQYLVTVYTR